MKLFVTDLDGTLLNSNHTLDESMKNYILKLRKEGHLFGVATGRPFPSALIAVPEITEIFDFGVFNNGSNFIDFKDQEKHDQYPLDRNTMIDIINTYSKLGANPVMFIDDVMYTHNRDKYNERLLNSGFNIEFGNFDHILNEHHEKVVFSVDETTRNRVFAHYEANPNEKYVAFMSQAELVEFMDPRIDKWVGVKYYIDKYKHDNLTTITFGDNGNDLELIQGADIGVAMENAIEELKDAADHITLANDESGVQAFIESYLKNL